MLMECAGSIPIIRCPKGGAAEMIAAKLDRKLRDHILNAKDNLFSGSRSAATAGTATSRPVLISLIATSTWCQCYHIHGRTSR